MVAVLDTHFDDPGPRGREKFAPLRVVEAPVAPTANAVDRALVVGDMHGNLMSWQRTIIPAAKKAAANVIIQLGDFGFGWNLDYLPALDELLAESGIPVLWIDGNHENFDMLTAVGAFPEVDRTSDLAVMTSHAPVPLLAPHDDPCQTSEMTWYLPRGCAWEWYGRRMLAIGGAYSVDKPYRTPHVSWWEQEELTDLDVQVARSRGPVDIVFSHDVFSGVHVPGVHVEWKQDEFAELSAPNRQRLWAVKDSAQPSLWVHGHFHVAYTTQVESTEVVGLNCESETGSMVVLDFPSLEWSAP